MMVTFMVRPQTIVLTAASPPHPPIHNGIATPVTDARWDNRFVLSQVYNGSAVLSPIHNGKYSAAHSSDYNTRKAFYLID